VTVQFEALPGVNLDNEVFAMASPVPGAAKVEAPGARFDADDGVRLSAPGESDRALQVSHLDGDSLANEPA